MDTSLHALAAFAGWTLLHTFIILGHRSILINTGKAAPNAFGPSRDDKSSTFIGRVGLAHANCVENLVVLVTILLINHLLEGASDVSQLAWYIVYARIGQSITHWASVSETAVAIRFFFFVYQLSTMLWILYKTILP